MYYPILRGKLNELLALRDLANLSIDKKFCPVIEPVRSTLSPLFRTIKELNDKEIEPLIF
ncbi:sce7725 family protein [Acinetobacter pittii]|nr:sce7725 family protein [Acinetobacter pittii]